MENYNSDFEIYLRATPFIDSDSKAVIDFVNEICTNRDQSRSEQIIAIYYQVRDRFLYNPYKLSLTVKGFKASTVIENGYGFCITKATLLAASARIIGVPSRLGFVDVKNHLTSEKLTKIFGNIFVYHAYAELFLDGKWVKATPAFNAGLCEKFNVEPLPFDGKNDSLFQEFNKAGNKYMEYVNDRGVFHDVPYDNIVNAFKGNSLKSKLEIAGNFEEDALKTVKEDIIIYTDGACKNNPGQGGYGVVIKKGNKRTELSAGYRLTTNNRMEILGCIAGLSQFKDKTSITIFSDSKYVVDAITKGWAKRWKRNKWMRNRDDAALNPDLWEKLLSLCELHNVKFEWVRGHAGNPDNERSDKLAVEAAQGSDLLVDEGYDRNC